MSRSRMVSSMSLPSATCMLARTICWLTLAVPTNLTVIVPTLAPAPGAWLTAGDAAESVAGAVGAGAVCAQSAARPASSASRQATRRRTIPRPGLLGVIFKAGDVSQESELSFSYRPISLLGND